MGDHVQQIKDRLSIEEVVGSYVSLEPAGKNMRACCPLHNERTPSFYVTPEKGIYKCFGCGKGGDIFSFLQEMEGIEFRDALKTLAERAGVELSQESGDAKKIRTEREQLFTLMDTAMKWLEVQLRTSPEIVKYLTEDRGLTKETLVNFHVGYAPAGWGNLVDALRKRGFSDDFIMRAGLAIDGDKGLYDRFRERIMFPIFDDQGRPVAFSGRIFTLPDSRTDTSRVGKYVNSPEGELYDKSRILFGYDRAKQSMKQAGHVCVVEGQVDLLMAHQAGTTHSVALSGTALTPQHCALIKRFTDTVVLALDGDDAGFKAAGRSVRVATEHDMKVQVVVMPDGTDPADIIQRDPQEWEKLIAEPRDYIDVRLEHIREQTSDPHARLKALHTDVYDLIAGYQNPILRDHYIQRVVAVMGTTPQSVHEDFHAWNTGFQKRTTDTNTPAGPITLNLMTPKEMLIGYIEGREDEAVQKHLIDYTNELFAGYGFDITYERLHEIFGTLIDELVVRVNVEQPEARSAGLFVKGLVLQMIYKKLKEQEHGLGIDQLEELDAVRKKIDEVKGKMNEV